MPLDISIKSAISKLAQEELGKRQYYRPVYSLHKWWARRPGALFRSIILLSAKELGYLDFSKNMLFECEDSGELSTECEFFQYHDLNQLVILDPFMGGGTTLVEGNRLGAKVIGSDINPVAYWIVRETLKNIDIKKLDNYFSIILEDVNDKMKSLYTTKCKSCGNDHEDILYSFWVRHIDCPKCGKTVYLFSRYLLNKGMKRIKGISASNPAVAVCPKCLKLTNYVGGENCNCSHCGEVFDPDEMVFSGGSYTCSHCRTKSSLIKTIKNGGNLQEKLIAIEYYCSHCNERLYKSPDDEDLRLIKDINNKFEASKDKLLFPEQKIPKGTSSARWISHDFCYYKQIFNQRQILAFNYLIESINKIPEEEYKFAFITVFSNSLEYNNMMVPYNYPHRKLHHLFNYHALPLTTMPVENNVLGVAGKGSGTFENCYERYRNAKLYCASPFDKFKENTGDIRTIESNEKISANFVSSFAQLKNTPKGAMINCTDSSNLEVIQDNSIDLVITDPPYFDNIHYSELSNFFYVWLKLFNLGNCFEKEYVPMENEAIVNNGMNKTEDEYLKLMTSVFKESWRVLKNSGKLIFTFHHSNPKAWWVILDAVKNSGFYVVNYFPAKSEYKVNPHVRDKTSIDTDLVIICDKKPNNNISNKFDVNTVKRCAEETILFSNGSIEDSILNLYFIGEMLKIGTHSDSEISPEFFEFVFNST